MGLQTPALPWSRHSNLGATEAQEKAPLGRGGCHSSAPGYPVRSKEPLGRGLTEKVYKPLCRVLWC